MLNTIIGICVVVLCAVVIWTIILIANISGAKQKFDTLPPSLLVRKSETCPAGQAEYSLILMHFSKWKKLFELDPNNFIFIFSDGTRNIPGRITKTPFEIMHPCHICDSEGTGFFLIEFSELDYFRYYLYSRKIADKYCALEEQKISLSVVGNIREKIDALESETQQNIQRALELQREIVLRLDTGEDAKKKPETSHHNDKEAAYEQPHS